MRLGILLAVMALSSAGCINGDLREAAAKLPEQEARMRALGLPMTAAELVPPRKTASGKLAAPLVEQFKLMRSKDLSKAIADPFKDPATPDWKALETALTLNEGTLKLIERIAACDALGIDHDWDQNVSLLFPEFAAIKEMSKVLTARAELRAHQGQMDAAIQDLERIGKLAGFCKEEPVLIAGLVTVAIVSIQSSAARYCAAYTPEREADLAKLVQWLRSKPVKPDLVQALRGEFYFALSLCRNMDLMGDIDKVLGVSADSAPSEPMPAGQLRRSGLPEALIQRAYLARFFEFWGDVFEAIKGTNDPVAIGDALKSAQQKYATRKEPSYRLLNLLLPVFDQASLAYLRPKASRNLATAYARVLLHHSQSGQWPRNLMFQDSLLDDPYSGTWLGYSYDQNAGFKVWSVGPDRKDDGGVSVSKPGGTRDDVYAYPPGSR